MKNENTFNRHEKYGRIKAKEELAEWLTSQLSYLETEQYEDTKDENGNLPLWATEKIAQNKGIQKYYEEILTNL